MDRFGYNKGDSSKKEKTSIRRYIKKYTLSTPEVSDYSIVKREKRDQHFEIRKREKEIGLKNLHQKDAELLATKRGQCLSENVRRRHEKRCLRMNSKCVGKKNTKICQKLSGGRFYRLRASDPYREKSLTGRKDYLRCLRSEIGMSEKPQPNGKPGYIRADTVHQGDLDGVKGVYHVNLVDEVTQWEALICVDSILKSMAYVLHQTLQLPLPSSAFTSDNGGENINGSVSLVLQKLLVEQTKSRSGKCNDNALIEKQERIGGGKAHGTLAHAEYEARKINAFIGIVSMSF